MRIIPAIDIIDGKCVRLTQGDYEQKKIYNEDPLEVAKMYEDAGITFLHLVDLDGARSGRIINTPVLERIASQTRLHIDFGGGIKRDADIETAFNSGARQVTCGSIAVKEPGTVLKWVEDYGTNRLIVGADVKDRKIAVHGWKETTSLEIEDLLHTYVAEGLEYVICTDIATDGMLQGPNFGLYEDLLNTFPSIKLIASGGVSSMDDLHRLQEMSVDGVIIGKAIYEGRITLEELKKFADA